MRKILLSIAFLVTLSGCGDTVRPYVMPVWRQDLVTKGIENASPTFNDGWRDGCETGSATSATHLQRLSYGFKMNEQLIENEEYYNGWSKGFRYCHRYLYQYHRKMFSN